MDDGGRAGRVRQEEVVHVGKVMISKKQNHPASNDNLSTCLFSFILLSHVSFLMAGGFVGRSGKGGWGG